MTFVNIKFTAQYQRVCSSILIGKGLSTEVTTTLSTSVVIMTVLLPILVVILYKLCTARKDKTEMNSSETELLLELGKFIMKKII